MIFLGLFGTPDVTGTVARINFLAENHKAILRSSSWKALTARESCVVSADCRDNAKNAQFSHADRIQFDHDNVLSNA